MDFISAAYGFGLYFLKLVYQSIPPMLTAPTFHVRGLGEGIKDGQFMIDAFDASLPQLAAIGSGGQWGSEKLSEKSDAIMEEKIKIFEQAKRYQLTGEGDPIQIFIVEAEIPSSAVDELPASVRVRTDDGGKKFLAVGSVMLSEGLFPQYMRAHFDKDSIKKELDGTKDYIYLEALITDYRTGSWRRGAGAALIEHARRFCRERRKQIIYVDAYAGNGRKLVQYYENQGFSAVDDFENPMPGGSKWPGTFFRLDLTG
ncbi:acetyltransferase [Xylariaceae sp. AK1471]|nr:acetyltransferase [Xylariaceae sp. AK1471]